MKTIEFCFCLIFVFQNVLVVSSFDTELPRDGNSLTTQDVVKTDSMENEEKWNRLSKHLANLYQICDLLNNDQRSMMSEAPRMSKTDHDNKTVHGSISDTDILDVINRGGMADSVPWAMHLEQVNGASDLAWVQLAIKGVKRIDKIVPLYWYEKLEEGIRSFLGFHKSAHITHLLNEELANERIAREILKLMATYGINYYMVASAIWESHNLTHKIIHEEADNYMNMREWIKINKISRALPHIKTLDKDANLFCRMDENEEPAGPGWQDYVVLFFENLFEPTRFEEPAFEMMDYKCRNAFGIFKSHSSITEIIFYSLHDGADTVFSFEFMKNIFFLQNGRKIIHGGLRDDRFVCYGNNTTGVLNGSSGYNTLDMSNVQNGGTLTFKYDPSIDNESLHITGEYFNILANNINEIVGRKIDEEVVQCHCGIHKLDLKGGSKIYSRDKIVIPDLKCHFNIIIELQGYTFITNIAKNGSFIYIIDGAKKSNTYLLQANNVINTVRFKNIKFTDLNIVYKKKFVTFTIKPSISRAMFFKVSTPALQSTIVHFENNAAMMWKNGHTIISLKSEKSILEIIDEYANFLDKLRNATLMVTSTYNNERTIFSHNLVQLTHNNGSTKMVNVIHNGKGDATLYGRKDQENYFMIQAHYETNSSRDIQNFRIGNLTIRGLQETKKNYIDLHKLSKQLSNKNYELVVKAEKAEQSDQTNDIILNLYAIKSNREASKIKVQLIGSIKIVDGAADDIYSTFDIFVYRQRHLKKNLDNFALEVDPINLDNKNILVLHYDQFERGTEFIFDKNITSMDLFHISDKHLILSYKQNYISYPGLENLLTIIFVDYFNNTEKFQSVTLKFNQDFILSVQELLLNVQGVAPISSLWRSIDEKLTVENNNPRGIEYKIIKQ